MRITRDGTVVGYLDRLTGYISTDDKALGAWCDAIVEQGLQVRTTGRASGGVIADAEITTEVSGRVVGVLITQLENEGYEVETMCTISEIIAAGEFDESKHQRDADGKFTESSGGGKIESVNDRRERDMQTLADSTKSLATRLTAARELIATIAQQEYDNWEQDEDGEDPELGTGGICDRIAAEIGNALAEAGVETMDGGQPGDEHAWLIAYTATEAFGIDVPMSLYEMGGGYKWTKLPDVTLKPGDVEIWRMNRAELDDAIEHADDEYDPDVDDDPEMEAASAMELAAGFDWDESLHPRDDSGMFIEVSNGGVGVGGGAGGGGNRPKWKDRHGTQTHLRRLERRKIRREAKLLGALGRALGKKSADSPLSKDAEDANRSDDRKLAKKSGAAGPKWKNRHGTRTHEARLAQRRARGIARRQRARGVQVAQTIKRQLAPPAAPLAPIVPAVPHVPGVRPTAAPMMRPISRDMGERNDVKAKLNGGPLADLSRHGGGIRDTFSLKIGNMKAFAKANAPTDTKHELGAQVINEVLNLVDMPVSIRRDLGALKDPRTGTSLGEAMVMEYRSDAKTVPDPFIGADPEEMKRMGLFDAIIGNHDRHVGNVMKKNGGGLVAIDHGFAFPKQVPQGNYVAIMVRPAALDDADIATLYKLKDAQPKVEKELTKAGLDNEEIDHMWKRVDDMLQTGQLWNTGPNAMRRGDGRDFGWAGLRPPGAGQGFDAFRLLMNMRQPVRRRAGGPRRRRVPRW